ncbi:MAG: hypothetical protein CMK44_07615 [Porticoccus sp.]|jgi:hypothetical protein|nr:hypothetical protein [Porticoccus sp.]|tara:strand:- start:249 stop:629 length:381 start_codon:yes stop_codon:yes gene_type:complete
MDYLDNFLKTIDSMKLICSGLFTNIGQKIVFTYSHSLFSNIKYVFLLIGHVMERPDVAVGDFIILKGYKEDPGMEAKVFKIEDDGILFVGYHAYSIRTTKAHAFWNDSFWQVTQKHVPKKGAGILF